MSKKGFLASLIIAIVATLSLSIYTIVSVVNPGSSNSGSDLTLSLAFRSGETVEELKGYTENKDLTFTLGENQENPLEFNAEENIYVAKDVNGTVTAVVNRKDGYKTTYNISVYHHNAEGLSAEEPYIIATKAHLKEFAGIVNTTGENKVSLKYVSLVSDIDLTGEDWKPLGARGNAISQMVFEGNNHAIKNMSIKVTSENYKDYLAIAVYGTEKVAYLDLGFFGRIQNNFEIKNVSFTGAEISVSAEVYEELTKTQGEDSEFNKFVELSIGTVVGSAQRLKVENVSANSKIKAFSCTATGDANGVGGIIGSMQLTQISNSKVKLDFTENVIHNLSEIETVKGSYVGGIVGDASTFAYKDTLAEEYLAKKNVIENCEVEMSVNTVYNNVSIIGGLAGRMVNTVLKNSTVKSLKAIDPTPFKNIVDVPYATLIAGAAGYIDTVALDACTLNRQAYAAEIENVKVEGLDITMIGGQVAGLVGNAKSTTSDVVLNIKDCSVKGSMTGFMASGFAMNVGENVKISFSDEFVGETVDTTIAAYAASAFAYEFFGSVQGNEAKTVKVVATLVGKGNVIDNGANLKVVYDNTFGAGFGYIGSAESTARPVVSNLVFELVGKETLSFAGIAHNAYGAQISNCEVNAKYTSCNYYRNGTEYRNFSTTYMIAGAVANAFENTTIDGVKVTINVNQDVDKKFARGANYFGGVVARIQDNNVAINNCEVIANVYVNDAYQTAAFKSGEESVPYGKVFLAGGLVGSIQKRGNDEVDAFTLVDTSNVKFNNNKINYSIIVDFKAEKAMGSQGYRVRALGAVVGNINSNIDVADTLDLTTCQIENYFVKADKTTFSYGYESSGAFKTLSTMGLQVLTNEIGNNIVYAYGMSYNHNMGVPSYVKNPEDMTKARFEALEA